LGIVALPVSNQEEPMFQKGCFLFFLYMKGLLFVCVWWCLSKEFLLKIFKLKCMALLCSYYRFWHDSSQKGEISKGEHFLFLSNFNGFFFWWCNRAKWSICF